MSTPGSPYTLNFSIGCTGVYCTPSADRASYTPEQLWTGWRRVFWVLSDLAAIGFKCRHSSFVVRYSFDFTFTSNIMRVWMDIHAPI